MRLLHSALTLPALACLQPSPSPTQPPPLPGFVVAQEEAPHLLAPCSADPPAPIDSTWTPTSEHVRALERGLPAYTATASWTRPGFGPTRPLREYIGQYTGFYQGTQRWVYGRFGLAPYMPKDSLHGLRVMHWCDGGGHFFGVEYSPDTGEFRHLRRNEGGTVVR